MASSAQMDLLQGRGSLPPELGLGNSQVIDTQTVRRAHQRRARNQAIGAATATLAMLTALSFGYVAVRGFTGLRPVVEPPPAEAAPAAVPAPPPEPTTPAPPAPEPALEPVEEPAVVPAPVAPAPPKPTPTPRAAPAPTTPPPAPPPSPAPKIPEPARPTGSDLDDPWAQPGASP